MEQENTSPNISTQLVQNFSGKALARNRSIIPLGYVLVFLLFAFSFCDFKCNIERVGSVTGYDLVLGKYVKANPILKAADTDEVRKLIKPIYKSYEDDKGHEMNAIQVPSNNWAIIALITAALGLIIFMFASYYKPHVAITTGIIGVFSMLMVHSTVSQFVNDRFSFVLTAGFTPAFWLTMACFGVVALVGFYKLKYPVLAGIEEPYVEGDTERVPSPPPSLEDFISNNKWALLGSAFLIITCIVFYKAYIKKDYTDDLKALAVEVCECEKQKKDEEAKKLGALLAKIRKAKREDYEMLNKEFSKVERKIDKEFERCNKDLQQKFDVISEKAKGTDNFSTKDIVEEKFKEYRDSTRIVMFGEFEDEENMNEKVEKALDSLKYSYERDTTANPFLEYLYKND